MSRLSIGVVLALLVVAPRLPAQEVPPTGAVALERLREGNVRFAEDRPARKDVGTKRRVELARGQHPFAIVLACADSRVAPELIFDQGLGELFVIRLAGNVTDPEVLGSIEYAVDHLKAPLVVVLGHDSCGAVKAVMDGGHAEGNLGKLLERVHAGDKQAGLDAGIRTNVLYQTGQLTEQSTVLKDFVSSQRLRVAAGIYSLKSGRVEWLEIPAPK